MPTISELIASGASNPSTFGIVADVDDVTPPAGLKEAGIIVEMEAGDVSDKVLDAAISWSLAGIDVTLEIPHEAEVQDPSRLLSTAAAVGLSLSILPPAEIDDVSFEAWCSRVECFARSYVTQANMSKFVYPVTSYLGYMFIEACSPRAAAGFRPDDPYVLGSFHERVPQDRADALKARIRAVFTDAYGGEEGFASFARALCGTIYRTLEEGCAEEARRLYAERPGEA